MYDVLIVGAGPAGLSAALLLGRCRRRVLVCDADQPRNAASQGLHGFLTRDGIDPRELRRLGRAQLRPYGVTVRQTLVTGVRRRGPRFVATLQDGRIEQADFLVLATGVVDELPLIDGFRRFYGAGVFHCPYCDGWEMRDRRLAAYGRGVGGMKLALALKTWSPRVLLLTDGPGRLTARMLARLHRYGIPVQRAPVARLEGGRRLDRVEFRNGSSVPCDAIFFRGLKYQHSALCGSLGCTFARGGAVRVRRFEKAGPKGLYVIGDASAGTQMAITAAAEGVRAAISINEAIERRDRP